jgi:hypothetical protein
LKCECGGELRLIAFITEHKVIKKILSHLDTPKNRLPRSSPTLTSDFDHTACATLAGTRRPSGLPLRLRTNTPGQPPSAVAAFYQRVLTSKLKARLRTVFESQEIFNPAPGTSLEIPSLHK